MSSQIEKYLNETVQSGASDLILAEGLLPAFRVAGEVCPVPGAEKLEFGALEGFLGSLDGENGAFAGGPWAGTHWRVRYSREAFGKMAVLRSIGMNVPTLASLQVPDPVESLLDAGMGIVIFAGPASSGKTTTASAYISELCARNVLRAAFLDPLPEYEIRTGNCLVHRKRKNVSVAEEIEQGVRSGTDLFWLGDIGEDSCLPMLRAADAGALVVATVTANSARDVLTYLSAAGHKANIRQTLLSANLKAIVSERLILSADRSALIPAWEVLYNDTNIAPLILSGDFYKVPQAMRSAVSEGMLPLDDYLLELVRRNFISAADARAHALDEMRFL